MVVCASSIVVQSVVWHEKGWLVTLGGGDVTNDVIELRIAELPPWMRPGETIALELRQFLDTTPEGA